jgi:hypothetical protein
MHAEQKWKRLGWRHPLWDLLRFYLSVKHQVPRARWLERLDEANTLSVEDGKSFEIDPVHVALFFEYLRQRESDFAEAFGMLRSEAEALRFCRRHKIRVAKTTTKNQDHHQSSKAMVATVSALAAAACVKAKTTLNANPQTRCVWCLQNGLHVSARNIDGAIPSLANPAIIWEIKEYWGLTSGGSKMSDAVYECNLVGRELREFEERTQCRVIHVVFIDGKAQWTARVSDLKRFIDLMNQGFIDHLFVGREVETAWEPTVVKLLAKGS